MKFNKEMGQVFLTENSYIKKIIDSLDVEGKDVLEVGPGRGEITRHLINKVNSLFCVELDTRLVTILEKHFSSYDNFKVITGDILKIDLSVFKKRLVLVGNVPYYISNQLIKCLINQRAWVERAYFTFQREFAGKLCAKAGDKSYSFLSCYVQYFCRAKIIFEIPNTAFRPRPKVDSSFVQMDFLKAPPYEVKDEKLFFKLIRTAFAGRRKKLINALNPAYDKELLSEAAKNTGLDLGIRPDSFPLEGYCKITNYLTLRV